MTLETFRLAISWKTKRVATAHSSMRTQSKRRCQSVASLLTTLLSGSAIAATAAPQSVCWRDYPIPTTAVSYERAFASETLVPERIIFNGRVIQPGMSQSSLSRMLGTAPIVVEDWQERTDEGQCEYLLTVLRAHPNSMHLYKLGELKWQKLSGAFRVSEWRLPRIGTLSVFFHRPSGVAVDKSYLYHLKLSDLSAANLQSKKGRRNVLVRGGLPRIEWDIDKNHVLISGQDESR